MAVFQPTEIQSYLRCRRQWHYASENRLGLERNTPSKALSLGLLVHSALEDWLNNPQEDASFVAQRFAIHQDEMIEELRKKYLQRVKVPMSEFELQPAMDIALLGLRMVVNYAQYWKTPIPEGFEVISTEQVITAAVPGTYHFIQGRIDGLLRHKDTGMLAIIDHKTYSQRTSDSALKNNLQFLIYTWIVNQLGLGTCMGVAYDGLWKRESPPKGRVIHDLFYRTMLVRSPEELTEFVQIVPDLLNEMTTGPAIFPHRTWNGSCEWDCDFESLCTAQSRQEDFEHIISTGYGRRLANNRERVEES